MTIMLHMGVELGLRTLLDQVAHARSEEPRVLRNEADVVVARKGPVAGPTVDVSFVL